MSTRILISLSPATCNIDRSSSLSNARLRPDLRLGRCARRCISSPAASIHRCLAQGVGVRRGLGVRGALHPPPTHAIPVTAGAAFASCCPPPGALLTGKTLRACELRHEMQLRGEQPKSWSGIHSMLCPDTPAPTVTCHVHKPGAYRCMLHGGLFHRLSLEEAACLQGFPAGTHFVGAANARFRQVGNAVPPPLANAIAMRLRVLLALGGTAEELRACLPVPQNGLRLHTITNADPVIASARASIKRATEVSGGTGRRQDTRI